MKTKVKSKIFVRTYDVVRDVVERGTAYGWNRAHKYTDNPDADTITSTIESAVMDALCEVLDFGDE